MFIPLAYPGSLSDKEITKQSGYLDMMEPYTELMVEKGFNISGECTAGSESDAGLRSYKNKLNCKNTDNC